MAKGMGAVPKKKGGTKVVVGSTSTVRLGKDHRQHVTGHAKKFNK